MKIEQQTKKFNEIDDDLAQLLLVDAPETSQQSSLIGSIISLCSPNKQDCESMSSTNQVIYQFFIHVLIYVSKGGIFLQKCYEMIEKLSNGNKVLFLTPLMQIIFLYNTEDHQESIHYVKSKTQASMLNIMEAMEKALKRYSEPIHLKSHLKLLNSFEEDVDFVRMQRVAYNVILAEDSFGRCDMDCPYYDYSKINRTECRGSVYECTPSAALSNHVYEVFSVSIYVS